jgi:hypothetical protein
MEASMTPSRVFVAVAAGVCGISLWGQTPGTMDQRIAAIVNRPEFSHARFGMEFRFLDAGAPVYR